PRQLCVSVPAARKLADRADPRRPEKLPDEGLNRAGTRTNRCRRATTGRSRFSRTWSGPLDSPSTTARRSTTSRIASVACGLHFMNPVAADSDLRVVLLDCRLVRRVEDAVDLVLGLAVQDVVMTDAKLVGWGHLSRPELFGCQRVHGVRIDEFRHRPGDGAIDTRPLLPSRNRARSHGVRGRPLDLDKARGSSRRAPAIRPSERPWTVKSVWSYLESDHRSSVPGSGSARCPRP